MRTLKIIDSLHSTDDGLKAKTRNGRFQQVHLRQGDLDGACAVYAAMMNLLLIGVVKYSDIRFAGKEYDKRYGIERLKKELYDLKGLHREGNLYGDLKSMLLRAYAQFITVEHFSEEGEMDVPEVVSQYIQGNQPVIISIDLSPQSGHALLAIGVEYNNVGEPVRIMCLDPEAQTPFVSYWNCVIELNANLGKYKHRWMNTSGACADVQLGDMLVIERK